MREGIYREIEADYERMRAENRAEETRRLALVTEKNLRIGMLFEERSRLFHARAAEAFANPSEAMSISASLAADVASLQASIRKALLEAGYPEDYLQPIYHCAVCKDTGRVGESIQERCACFQKRLREHILSAKDTGLNGAETFETFDEQIFPDTLMTNAQGMNTTQREHMARVRNLCRAYADAFPNTQRRNLLLVGMSGLGKTFLMNCIGNQVASKGGEVYSLTAYQLTERMRSAIFDRDPEAFSMLLKVPLLLLDDLGVESMIPNITIEQLFTLLNERGLSGLHTVISTNLMPEELKRRYTERVCSRLFDRKNTVMYSFLGQDVRMRMP